MQVAFFLEKAGVDYFVQWLKRYCSIRGPFFSVTLPGLGDDITISPTEPLEGEMTSRPAEPVVTVTLVPAEPVHHRNGSTHITIDGLYRLPDEPSSSPSHRLPGMIVLDVMPFDSNDTKGLEVLALCTVSRVMKRFKEILGAIAERWPSAAEPIAKALGTPIQPAKLIEDGASNGEATERLPHPDVRKRRKEVEKLWRQGLTDSEIAGQLFVSESTVKRDREVLDLKTRS